MRKIDDLLKELENTTGHKKIDLLNDISNFYSRIDLKKCKEYADKAYKLSKELNYYDGEAASLKNLALFHFSQGEHNDSEFYIKEAIKIVTLSDNKNLLAKFTTFYSLLLQSMGKLGDAYEKGIFVYHYYEKTNDEKNLAYVLNLLGILYKQKGEHKNALNHYKKALLYAKKSNDEAMLANVKNNMGVIYRRMDKFDMAVEYFKETLAYFKKINNKLAYGNGLNNIATTYESKKDYDKAKKYNKKARSIFEEIGDKSGVVISDYNLASIYINLQKWDDAENLLTKVLKFYTDSHNLEMLKNIYYSLYEINKESKKYSKALKYHEKFYDIKIKILSESKRKEITELEAKYKFSQKEKQLKKALQSNIRLKNEQLSNKLLLKQLRNNKDFYQSILEKSYNGIIMVDRNFNIIYANQLFYKLFEINEDNTHKVADVFDKSTMEKIYRHKDEVINMGNNTKGFYLETNTINGKRQNIEINVSQFKNNEDNWVILIHMKDITELHEKDESLRVLMRAFEQSPTSILIANTLENITYVNPKFTKLTGYSPKEVIGQKLKIPKFDDSKIPYRKKGLKNGNEWTGVFSIRKKDGSSYWERATISPVLDKFGKITHYIKIAEDITDQKKADEKIQILLDELQKANASKDKFFSIIAHDLKSPFSTISSFVNIMKKYYDKYDREKLLDLINKLDKSTKNTYLLLENLLTWSQLQSGRIVANAVNFDLNPVVMKIVGLYMQKAEQKGISLKYHLPNEIEVYADRFMIETTIRNLVNNALKFTPSGGVIDIDVKSSDNFCKVSIKDTGVGILQKDIKNLFNIDTNFSTYGTNNEKGTGLGLILCKDFMDKNKGKIWVESEIEKGTTFYLNIPKPK